MRPILLYLSLLVFGCERPAPRVSETTLQKIKADSPGITDDCLDRIRWGGFEAMPNAVDECFVMTKPERWSGSWNVGFEWSDFCPDGEKGCSRKGRGGITLTFADEAYRSPRFDGLYEIEFVGRRTRYPGHFGHLGMYEHAVIADRLISVRKLNEQPFDPVPPKGN